MRSAVGRPPMAWAACGRRGRRGRGSGRRHVGGLRLPPRRAVLPPARPAARVGLRGPAAGDASACAPHRRDPRGPAVGLAPAGGPGACGHGHPDRTPRPRAGGRSWRPGPGRRSRGHPLPAGVGPSAPDVHPRPAADRGDPPGARSGAAARRAMVARGRAARRPRALQQAPRRADAHRGRRRPADRGAASGPDRPSGCSPASVSPWSWGRRTSLYQVANGWPQLEMARAIEREQGSRVTVPVRAAAARAGGDRADTRVGGGDRQAVPRSGPASRPRAVGRLPRPLRPGARDRRAAVLHGGAGPRPVRGRCDTCRGVDLGSHRPEGCPGSGLCDQRCHLRAVRPAAASRSTLARTPIADINQATSDQIGWPTYVAQIADVHRGLPPDEARAPSSSRPTTARPAPWTGSASRTTFPRCSAGTTSSGSADSLPKGPTLSWPSGSRPRRSRRSSARARWPAPSTTVWTSRTRSSSSPSWCAATRPGRGIDLWPEFKHYD